MKRTPEIPAEPEQIPTAAERVALELPNLRYVYGDSAAFSAAVSSLGVPMSASVLSRIETGKQPVNLDEVLLLALLKGGLRHLLRPPFRIGEVVIRDADDFAGLIGEYGAVATMDAGMKASSVADSYQERQLALVLDVDVEQVRTAAKAACGLPMNQAINQLTHDKIQAREGEYLTVAARQAIRSHAVRTIRRAIADYIEEHAADAQ